jgi:hypothetical protein
VVAAALAVPILLAMLFVSMPGSSHRGPLPDLTPDEAKLRDALARHVEALAGRIGERNMAHPDALLETARYVQDQWRSAGLAPEAHDFEVAGRRVSNIEVSLPGSLPGSETVVVGAHYDSVIGSPGANDNGSGVAAILELGRMLRARPLGRTVRLVAFANEEPPYFQTERMGSLVYARMLRDRAERVSAMISVETIGFYSEAPGSQAYPPPFGWFYPGEGNFIGFVGNTASRSLVRRAIGSFRRHTRFPSEGIAAPGVVPGIGWSDHWAFWKQGWPAIMVTDTAPFRYRHYHQETDTPDKLDCDRMARVVAGLGRVVEDLARP